MTNEEYNIILQGGTLDRQEREKGMEWGQVKRYKHKGINIQQQILIHCLLLLPLFMEVCGWFFIIMQYFVYSKTCFKRPLTNRQNKDLNDIW